MHRAGIAPIALLLLAVPACQKHLEPWPLSPATSPPASVLRPRQIIDRGLHDGMVTVEIVEPLDEASTTSPAGDAAYRVLVQDVGAKRMLLVPARTRVEREAGAMARLPRRLRPPVRARGVLAGERRDNVTLL